MPTQAQQELPTAPSVLSELPAPADVAAPPPEATKTPSGLATLVIQPGNGTDHPGPRDLVEVHYTGWTTDGKMFDSSLVRGKTARFSLNQVISGWTEGLQLMVPGEKRRLWIPENLAYKGQSGKPPGMLVFDVELMGVTQAPVTPPDVAAPPPDSKRTSSGLAWKVLKPGAGTETPGPASLVVVHYSGWTTDGAMFDSSVSRGKPARFRLDQVIPGWTEGLQLMTVGERSRFWIPEGLAYQGRPGKPAGMLVFDVELLEIVQ
ncbi:MAG: FKBP-type peptidyl-prolyl cis-trans isomerase [Deltaproteobacteria bacterium]|nr:FKBP-type peptidyl-prolyl cis-trans isomerase [Deltaproteobacteria bacterium]